jgi:hypothetical protein
MSEVQTHNVGDLIYIGNHSSLRDLDGNQLSAFLNESGAAADPTAVTIRVEDGTGETTVYTWPTGSPAVSKETTGRFYVARTPLAAEAGPFWYVRMEGTGTVQAVMQYRFRVREARPAP